MIKKIALLVIVSLFIFALAGFVAYKAIDAGLPQITSLKDYRPLVVSQVYDRNGKKVGEFFRERRILTPFDEIPKNLVMSFLAAEDDQFYQHKGINYAAITRAMIANLKAGRNVQGGSTITQQVAKTLLTTEKTYSRKIREAILARRIENNLSKDEILYLYLNQIYFGQGAWGIGAASETYFRKKVQQLKLSEMAILAGLPQAPSRYSPIHNPVRAKERQVYVLRRMVEVGFIKQEEADKAISEPVKVYVRENFEQYAPYYLETVRQLLFAQLGEQVILDQGVTIKTGLDIDKQIAANKAVEEGLRDLDKRQGFRGPLNNLKDPKEIETFISETRRKHILEVTSERIISPNGEFEQLYLPMSVVRNRGKDKSSAAAAAAAAAAAGQAVGLPPFFKVGDIVDAVVQKVDDAKGFVHVRGPDFRGIITFASMRWARKPNFEKTADSDLLRKPSDALKTGDVIPVKIVAVKAMTEKPVPELAGYIGVELEQEPEVESALLSFDQQTQDVLAMVGGYSFRRNEYNRALQAARQTGSSFKALVYLAALDKGYDPSTPIMDAPVVYEQTDVDEGQEETTLWKPSNHGRNYAGDITFRNALVRSLNIPTVKIIEDIGVPYATDYAHRLGIFSRINPDFTMALGSSSVTLYEMTKAFSTFGRLGKRIRPRIIHYVQDSEGKKILENVSLDLRFEKELAPFEEQFNERRKKFFETAGIRAAAQAVDPSEEPAPLSNTIPKDAQFFLADEDQLVRPESAFLITSLLKAAVEDPRGTGGRARAVGREIAGKTGTTNGYIDAWFMGYSAQIATGVWVGFDRERTLGRGEVGGRSALPIWVDYMKPAHEKLPIQSIPVPDNIVFLNIDSDTGKLASAKTKNIIRQAFIEGSEPSTSRNIEEETTDFLKQDMSE